MDIPLKKEEAAGVIGRLVAEARVGDIHTHLYDPAFGDLLLWGIDDLLVYHYLVAETFRYLDISYDTFWALTKAEQAELVWNELFTKRSPLSESCRGVVTTLNLLGIDAKKRDLGNLRKWFAKWSPQDYTHHVLDLARVKSVCMTNSPFDDLERPVWERGFQRDGRFKAALRIDPILTDWGRTAGRLHEWGYKVHTDLSGQTFFEVRRFLLEWVERINAQYVMVSLSPDFHFPGKDNCAQLIENAILPFCREYNLPFALMIGVKRGVNPGLRMAGDGMGRANLDGLANLCAGFPENKFLTTVLSRENQHELCVLARKFRNLHPFGCWWFTNIPSVIDEMTRMRLELLGLSMTPQHSDARVLDQLLYKWEHSRQIIGRVLAEKHADLIEAGWHPTVAEAKRDVDLLLGGSFEAFRAGVK